LGAGITFFGDERDGGIEFFGDVEESKRSSASGPMLCVSEDSNLNDSEDMLSESSSLS
jgi:hypothetical protein